MLDDQYQVKLIDFALSSEYDPRNKFSKFSDYVGTDPYVAPEIIEGTPFYPYPAEIFALGVCLYIMIFGVNPF